MSEFRGLALATLCLSGWGCAAEASQPDAEMQAEQSAGQGGAMPESRLEEATALPAGKVHDGPAVVVLPLSQESESVEDPTAVQVLEPDWDGCSPPQEEECEGNQAPVFGSPIYVVDGVQYEELSEIGNGQHLMLAVPVEDGDCNLACGEFRNDVMVGGLPGGGAGSLPSNVPCSTQQSGVHLGLSVPIAAVTGPDLEGRVDHYEYGLTVLDRCGLASARFAGTVDVRFENEPVVEPMEKPGVPGD